jgi:cell division protein ZapE
MLAWLQFVLMALATVLVALLVPGVTRRRSLVSAMARMALRLAGMRVEAMGLERLPRPCIVVANHCSYLDGVVLCAQLPSWFSFVIKREMAAVPVAGTLLRRIGAEFVARGDRARGARDARRLLRQAAIGQALVFFPEGTFSTEVGLMHFHIGAFAAAARANVPVVPIAIRGTRGCLPPGRPWPRPGSIRVDALAPLAAHPPDTPCEDRDRAPRLRDAARAALLAVLDEPDLGARAPAQGQLSERYRRELDAHGYQLDAAQLAAVDRLEQLRLQLLTAPGRGLWARLRRGLRPPRPERPRRGMYLWGGVGRGKTWLMDLFFDSVPLRARRRLHFHHFMRDVHRQLRQIGARRDPLEIVARRIARQAQLLCLDELFVSDIVDAMLLGRLLQALLQRGVVLVITSNVPPHELYRNGLQRDRFLPAIEVLERELEVVAVDGGIDYRLRQLQRQALWLDSASADSTARLRAIFEHLAGGLGERDELRIAGRRLRTLACHGDVVWFSFTVLCEGPRSSSDYADIAREFHSVLLSEVPKFTEPQHDNAARRFIALIDELYDQGVKLMASAAAAPFDLYRGERLQAEFARTASRLTEMQTEGYLARPRRA